MVKAGGAKMLLERDLTPDSLLSTLQDLLASPDGLRQMAEQSRQLARPGAAAHIARQILTLASR